MGLLEKKSFDPQLEIVPAHPDHLAVFWPIVKPWLAEAFEYGPKLFLPEDIEKKIKEQDMICWVAIIENEIVGFCITSFTQYPQARVCDIHWTGGAKHKGTAWLEGMFQVLKAWAKGNGCTILGGGGRRGWLRAFGFKEKGVIFEMEI